MLRIILFFPPKGMERSDGDQYENENIFFQGFLHDTSAFVSFKSGSRSRFGAEVVLIAQVDNLHLKLEREQSSGLGDSCHTHDGRHKFYNMEDSCKDICHVMLTRPDKCYFFVVPAK